MAFKDYTQSKYRELLDEAMQSNVTLVIGKGVSAEGFDSVLQINGNRVRLNYKSGKVEISGQGLKVAYLGKGELDIIGEVYEIKYENK